MSKPTLPERIDAILDARPEGWMYYHDLATALWPGRSSHNYRAGGGPPGCYMTLSAALRRGKFHWWFDDHSGHRKVMQRPQSRR
jgi:hypothetical protein